MIFCIGLNVNTERGRGLWASRAGSGQTKPLVVVQGLRQPRAQDLLAAVLGKVEEVVARVGHRQVLLPAGCGLNDDLQARHAVDGNPIAARQEHCGEREPGYPVRARCALASQDSTTPCGACEKYNHSYVPICVSLRVIDAHSYKRDCLSNPLSFVFYE